MSGKFNPYEVLIRKEDALEALERELIHKDGCATTNSFKDHYEAVAAGYDIGVSDCIKAIKRLRPIEHTRREMEVTDGEQSEV